MQEWKFEEIPVSELQEGIQVRIQTNEETVARYVEAIEKRGGKWPFPPIDVYSINGVFQIADGHHRKLAAERAGLEKISCMVHEGDEAALLKTAFKGNAKNALQMTDDDLRHGRELAILMFPNKSDRDLADICDCSPATINRDKRRLEEEGRFERPETIIGKNGKVYQSTVSVKHLPKKPAFNIDDFRKRCLEIRDEAIKEFRDLENQLARINGLEVEEVSEEERAAWKAEEEAQKKEFEKNPIIGILKKPVDDSEIFLFSELVMAGNLYFAYFISLKNGKPEILVTGWKSDLLRGEMRDTRAEEWYKTTKGETRECYCLKPKFFEYTVQRNMTPAEYLVTDQIELDPNTPPTGEPLKCNFLQELWAFRVLDEYRRWTAA